MIYQNRLNLPAMVAQRAANYKIMDFLDGMAACRAGIPHVSKNASFDAGYSTQYELEQVISEVFSGCK